MDVEKLVRIQDEIEAAANDPALDDRSREALKDLAIKIEDAWRLIEAQPAIEGNPASSPESADGWIYTAEPTPHDWAHGHGMLYAEHYHPDLDPEVHRAFARWYAGEGYDPDEYPAGSGWAEWVGTPEGRTAVGNPGEGTLHAMLSDAADHVDYESEVVKAAAGEIEDPAIAAAADKQAEAMSEAADALAEAADAARETAAEVFTETGIAQTDPKHDPDLDDVVSGNEITGESVEAGLREGADGMTCLRCDVVIAWDDLERHAAEVHDHQLLVSDLGWNDAIRGNPGETLIPAPSDPIPDAPRLIPDTAPPPAPTPEVADAAPESSHWYTKTLAKGRG